MASMGSGAISLAAGSAPFALEAASLCLARREIDAELRLVLERMDACPATLDEGARLSLADSRQALRRAAGALTMSGLEAASRIVDAADAVLEHGLQSEAGAAGILPVAVRALEGVRAYLAEVDAGSRHQPLHLLDSLSALYEARGEPGPESLALYFPDISERPLARRTDPLALPPGARAQYVRDQRVCYERGLLLFLKRDPSGVRAMRSALEAIERLPEDLEEHAFWAVMLAFFDALAANLLRAEDRSARSVTRLCQRLDGRLRAMAEGGRGWCAESLREALYFIARATPALETLREVRGRYGLDATLPPAGHGASLLPQRQARDLWSDAVQAWEGFSMGRPGELALFCEAASRLAGLAQSADPALLLRIASVGNALKAEPSRMSEALVLEQSVALLLAGASLSRGAAPDAGFGAQAELAGSRLEEALEGRLLRTEPQDPGLQVLFHRAQDALVARQTVFASQQSLDAIEAALARFVRDPALAPELAGLAEPLERLDRSLELLGEPGARTALSECALHLRRFSASDFVAQQPEFAQVCDAIADRLCALGARLEERSLRLASRLTLAEPPVDAAPPAPKLQSAPRVAAARIEPQDRLLEIGTVRVAAGTFALWSGEARMQVTTLKEELGMLKAHGIVPDGMLVAAHALAEAAEGVALHMMSALGRALDKVLGVLSLGPISAEEETLVERAVDALEQMVMDALDLKEPSPREDMVRQLEQLAAPDAAAGTQPGALPEVEVMVPEEEAAIEPPGKDPGEEEIARLRSLTQTLAQRIERLEGALAAPGSESAPENAEHMDQFGRELTQSLEELQLANERLQRAIAARGTGS